jgi:hypothetical protein
MTGFVQRAAINAGSYSYQWTVTLSFTNATTLPWVSPAGTQHVAKFVWKFAHALEEADKRTVAASLHRQVSF